MYLIANCQFGLSDGIVYCSELGDGCHLWRIGGGSTFSGSNYILVIASRSSTSKGSPPPCPLFIAEALVLLLNEWRDVVKDNTGTKSLPNHKYDFFWAVMSGPRFPQRAERVRTCAREKNPRSYWLVAFLGDVCGREALKLPEKQHTACALKKPAEEAACGRC